MAQQLGFGGKPELIQIKPTSICAHDADKAWLTVRINAG